MRVFELEAKQRIHRQREEVFAFFADAGNLERITPPWLRFHIVTPGPIEMSEGTIIDYRLRVHGLPMRWRSEITLWEPPHRFRDVQRRGPYRLWDHEHRFEEDGIGTLVTDHVRYALWGGALVHRFFVARDVERIFAYREKRMAEIFGGGDAGS
jgi:ligand-binding SRPBCC domain-containing protein